jgi:arylformamidase
MSVDWRDLSDEEMEKQFNPRAAVADTEQRLEDFIARSQAARDRIPGDYDLRYGPGPKETLDVHRTPNGRDRPLVLFIHGGYWRGLDKADHSFVAPPLLDTGAVVANVNYDLCPDITLDHMVQEIARAVRFCHAQAPAWGADPGQLYLFGHSAGAHLSAEMLLAGALDPDDPAGRSIQGVAAITGVYEPEVILRVTVNEEAQIDADTARARNCLDRRFLLAPEIVVAAGGAEPPGWIAQSRAFADACEGAGLPVRYLSAPGCNHFSVLDAALDPGLELGRAVADLWARR